MDGKATINGSSGCQGGSFAGLIRIAVAFGLLLAATPSAARFSELDADEVDQEERLTAESLIDAVSYRFPHRWDLLWDKAEIGYRMSAGSLNYSRFLYNEDIKFAVNRQGPIALLFRQERREYLIEQRFDQQIEVRLGPWENLYASLLGESGTFKKWGDIGFGLSYIDPILGFVEVYYWAVDALYNDKEERPLDRYADQTWTLGIKSEYTYAEWITLWFRFESDKLLTWERPSRNYRYQYGRRHFDYGFRLGIRKDFRVDVSVFHEDKIEDKEWTLVNEGFYEKGMLRTIGTQEIAVNYLLEDGGTLTAGFQNNSRDADYYYYMNPYVPQGAAEELPSPDMKRSEAIAYGTLSQGATIAGKKMLDHFFQYGLYVSWVDQRRDPGESETSTQIKFKFAWDYRFAGQGHMFVSSNWDIDGIFQNYPYKEKPFRPWNGGNIQFILAF